jgi:hypothetical protein
MQHAMHNRATIRVADRTDLSARVTADEVNLDRFHNRIRKVCALGQTWLALVTASVGLYLVLPDRGLAQSITVGTLKGTYVTAGSGYFTNSSGGLTLITSAGVETFFGDGTASGVVTVTIPGIAVFRSVAFKATYTPNLDGVSFSETTFGPETDHFDLYPTPDGSTIAQIQTDAGNFRSGVLTRSSGKAR